VYVGGGTPSLLADQMERLLAVLRRHFDLDDASVAVESSPDSCTPDTLRVLKHAGVNQLSVGIQTFHPALLKRIGRQGTRDTLLFAMENAVRCFDNVNVDLMNALPGENDGQVAEDLRLAMSCGAHQITVYPLFTFPYSSAGRFKRLHHVRMPSLGRRGRQYRLIHDTLTDSGYRRVSVWSFRKDEGAPYSSVTRNHYLGLGVGAASHVPGAFYFNTFSQNDYLAAAHDRQSPTALRLHMTRELEDYYWLYWRLYETSVPKTGLDRVFNGSDARPRRFLKTACRLGLAEESPDAYSLTRAGAFWIHWAQNLFVLDYINTMWRTARGCAFPQAVDL
jgi:oxygen-independent coproporphyrinogen-3 oxidase